MSSTSTCTTQQVFPVDMKWFVEVCHCIFDHLLCCASRRRQHHVLFQGLHSSFCRRMSKNKWNILSTVDSDYNQDALLKISIILWILMKSIDLRAPNNIILPEKKITPYVKNGLCTNVRVQIIVLYKKILRKPQCRSTIDVIFFIIQWKVMFLIKTYIIFNAIIYLPIVLFSDGNGLHWSFKSRCQCYNNVDIV